MRPGVGILRGAGLLIRLRVQRFMNMVRTGALFRRRPGDKRGPTPGKARGGFLVRLFLGAYLLFTLGYVSFLVTGGLMYGLGTEDRPVVIHGHHRHDAVPLSHAAGMALPPEVAKGTAVVLGLLCVCMVCTGTDLAKAEWDVEWLCTLPLSITSLFGIKILARGAGAGFGWTLLFPILCGMAWRSGHGWASLGIGVLAALPLMGMMGSLGTVLETWLRLRASPPRLRNLQAVLSVGGYVLYIASMFPAMSMDRGHFLFTFIRALPAPSAWFPTDLAMRAIAATETFPAIGAMAGLWLECGALLALCLGFLSQSLSSGFVAAGVRETGRSAAPAGRTREPGQWWSRLAPIQSKDLVLLARDRNFLVQTLVMPSLMVGVQVFLNPHSLEAMATSFRAFGVAAFGVAAYGLMFSAFQILNAEGTALWLLYSLPHPLEDLLRQKAAFWGTAALAYAGAIMAVGLAFSHDFSADAAVVMVLVLVGLPVYAAIAASLGVFACNPLEPDVRLRIRVEHLYLYLLLAGTYARALLTDEWWTRLAVVMLSVILAIALWQKMRDALPYLLDPDAAPPPQVSLSDGLIAAQAFFVLQAFWGLLLSVFVKGTGEVLLLAFAGAGATVYAATRIAYWRSRVADVPRVLGPGPGRALVEGLGLGALAASLGIAYVTQVLNTPWVREQSRLAQVVPGDRLWLLCLAVLAAPVFEEFIFRGLVFGGLRRSLGLWPSLLASAGIFAAVHPPVSVLPVFLMGCCAALAYERTRLLLAPMAVHAIYNAAVLGFQWWIR